MFIKPENLLQQMYKHIIAYYNAHRIHTTIGDMTPIEFEKGLSKVSESI